MLSKIFGRPQMTYRGAEHRRTEAECARDQHQLMPRWRGPEVMEDDSMAMGFVCHRCGREYLPTQVKGRRLIRTDV